MTDCIDEIHDYWFGPLNDHGMSDAAQHALWFKADPATDEHCRTHFGSWLERALAGELNHWANSDRGLLALIILLDQFSRNIYRGTPQTFSGDVRALELAQQTVASGRHQRLPAIHQVFLYLPLEHCEDLEVQEECVTLLQELAAITGDEQMAQFTRYAIAHRDVIASFGRFPHRNKILGRPSSPAEQAHLEKHGGF